MTLTQLIRTAIDTAVSGTDPDANVIQKLKLEAESLADSALHQLASNVASDPELRSRLTKEFSVTLSEGVGDVPAGMLTEYLREGSVRDTDASGSDGFGNVLVRVKNRNDFLGSLPTVYGYYCLVGNEFHTRAISSGSFTDTVGPLGIDAPFIPARTAIDDDVPDELIDDLVDLLAIRLRGFIEGQSTEGEPKAA